jgi:hypothetical protein
MTGRDARPDLGGSVAEMICGGRIVLVSVVAFFFYY